MTPLDYAAQICYSSHEVLQFSYDMAVKYKNSPGVFVETGVAAGAQIIAMAYGAPNKTIYAFDSFCGVPLPSSKDNQMPGIRMLSKEEQSKLPNPGEQVLESSGATSVSLYDFENHLRNCFETNSIGGMQYGDGDVGYTNYNNIRIVEGWFERTIPEWGKLIEPISILRLDGDLYNSTYVCLKYLYPKVIKGGLVIIDDWALPGCQTAVFDYFKSLGEGQDDFLYHDVHIISDKNSTVVWWTK